MRRRKNDGPLRACAAVAWVLVLLVASPAFSQAPSPTSPGNAAPSPTAPSPTPPASTAPAEDIRDIRGPKTIYPQWLIPALVAGALLLAAGGYAAWRWKHRPRPQRPLLPHEIALLRLEEARALMQPATVREFCIAISDIVRGHIEQAFEVTATHQTTEEFLHDLLSSENAALAAHRNLLAEFLHRCDEAKFAGMSLSTPLMESLHRSARNFVITTSPAASPAAGEGPPAGEAPPADQAPPPTPIRALGSSKGGA
jgi:hypothetical protein